MDSPTATFIGILQERVEFLRAAGNLNEALHAAAAAVEKAQQTLGSDLDNIDAFASSLEIRGDVYRQLGKLELARDDYRQAIDQLQGRPTLSRSRIGFNFLVVSPLGGVNVLIHEGHEFGL